MILTPYFYVPESQKHNLSKLDDHSKVRGYERVGGWKTLVSQEPIWRVTTVRSYDVREIRELFDEHYEADIIFTRRWTIDKFFNKDFADILARMMILDIEVEIGADGKMPNYRQANKPIFSVSTYDNYTDKYYTFAFRKDVQKIDDEKGLYIFPQESIMLKYFLKWYEAHRPDVITGWNVINFDVNYLYARLVHIFQKQLVDNIISPFGKCYWEQYRGRFGRDEERVVPKGVFIVDYGGLYKKNNQQMSESWKLDYIAEKELGERKLEFDGNVDDLYYGDFPKFLKYNRRDVYLVKKIDDKFQLIIMIDKIRRLTRTLFQDFNYTSAVVDGFLLCEAKAEHVALPSAQKDQHSDLRGAFVLEPKRGMMHWLSSYDLDSLYPNIIKTVNISPETKLGNINSLDKKDLSGEYVVGGNDIAYSKEFPGFIPRAMEKVLDLRIQMKNKMKELKSAGDPGWTSYDFHQKALKIICNSTYGYMSFRASRFFDIDMAEAVTMTGQKLIQWLEKHVNEYLNSLAKTKEAYVVAGDTDSCYVSFENFMPLVMKNWDKFDEDQKVKAIDRMGQKVQDHINSVVVDKFANEVLHTGEHFFRIKRETIARSAVFLAKKRYVMWVVDDEGEKVDKLKKVGIDIVRSNMSREIKKQLEEIIWLIMRDKTQKEVNTKVQAMIDNLRQMTIEDLAIPISLSKAIEEYGDIKPIHVRGAIWYNQFIKEKNLQPISGGDRIKYIPIEKERSKNILGERIHVISFPDTCPIPNEQIIKIINWKKLEERLILNPLEPIYDGMKWALPGKIVKTSLFDF